MILLFHKPKSIVVTRNDELGRKTVYDFLPSWVRDDNWLPVGRLDRDTRGLLLFVRDPTLIEPLTCPGHFQKIYEVWVRGHVQQHHLSALRNGIQNKEELLKCVDVELVGYVGPKSRLKLILDEGKNRQIRKMFGCLRDDQQGTPLKVLDLKRIEFGPIRLDVPSGHWRMLTDEEISALNISS